MGEMILQVVVACYLFALFVGGFYFTYRLRKRLQRMSAGTSKKGGEKQKGGSINPNLAKKVKDLTYFMALETFILFCTTVVSGTNALLTYLGPVSNETTPHAALAIKARVEGSTAPHQHTTSLPATQRHSAPAVAAILLLQ